MIERGAGIWSVEGRKYGKNRDRKIAGEWDGRAGERPDRADYDGTAQDPVKTKSAPEQKQQKPSGQGQQAVKDRRNQQINQKRELAQIWTPISCKRC